MDECILIAKKMRQLEENGELRVVYADLDNVEGWCTEKNSQYIIVLNSKLSYEKQLETVWHEAKHICSHVGCLNKKEVAEREAIKFSKTISQHPELLELCRNAW